MSLRNMEIIGAQNPSKVWGPTSLELRKFTVNKPKEGIDKIPNIMSSPIENQMYPIQESSIHTFLFKLTRRCNVRVNRRHSIEFMAEDAVHLCSMLRKEGYLGMENESSCAICAVEKLEQRVVRQMQKEIEITKQVRHCLVQLEDAHITKLICAKHKPFNPNDNIPKSNNAHVYGPYSYPLFSQKKPVLPAKNMFVIPNGENPAEYMALFFDWFHYFNYNSHGSYYTRMPYTKNFNK